MPAADEPGYTVQRFRGGFALCWKDETGKRHRRQLDESNRASAESEARRIWENSDDTPWTVGRIMDSYLASVADKPSNARRKDAWKAMKAFWVDVNPALIDEKMCSDYRAKRSRVSDTTARYELQQLSTALNFMGSKIAVKPKLWFPPLPERKIRHLTRDEFDRFYAEVRADHAKLYVMIGLHTTARPSAILQLEWNRVDFMRGLIDFTPEGHIRTNKRRTVVPINDDLMAALQIGHAARTCESVIEHGGKPVACIKKAFQAASVRSAVRATPYMLRHTGAVWMAEAGVPISEIAQFMGHDDSRTTEKHYSRYSPDYLRGASKALNRTSKAVA